MVFYFRKGTKKAVTKFVTAFLWTSQGLNLGPPDYESVALTTELQVQIWAIFTGYI